MHFSSSSFSFVRRIFLRFYILDVVCTFLVYQLLNMKENIRKDIAFKKMHDGFVYIDEKRTCILFKERERDDYTGLSIDLVNYSFSLSLFRRSIIPWKSVLYRSFHSIWIRLVCASSLLFSIVLHGYRLLSYLLFVWKQYR